MCGGFNHLKVNTFSSENQIKPHLERGKAEYQKRSECQAPGCVLLPLRTAANTIKTTFESRTTTKFCVFLGQFESHVDCDSSNSFDQITWLPLCEYNDFVKKFFRSKHISIIEHQQCDFNCSAEPKRENKIESGNEWMICKFDDISFGVYFSGFLLSQFIKKNYTQCVWRRIHHWEAHFDRIDGRRKMDFSDDDFRHNLNNELMEIWIYPINKEALHIITRCFTHSIRGEIHCVQTDMCAYVASGFIFFIFVMWHGDCLAYFFFKANTIKENKTHECLIAHMWNDSTFLGKIIIFKTFIMLCRHQDAFEWVYTFAFRLRL